jgi:hypothetical protein
MVPEPKKATKIALPSVPNSERRLKRGLRGFVSFKRRRGIRALSAAYNSEMRVRVRQFFPVSLLRLATPIGRSAGLGGGAGNRVGRAGTLLRNWFSHCFLLDVWLVTVAGAGMVSLGVFYHRAFYFTGGPAFIDRGRTTGATRGSPRPLHAAGWFPRSRPAPVISI